MEKTGISLSVVLPCLNEERSLDYSIREAAALAQKLGLSSADYEILVVDNGSRDASPTIASGLSNEFPVRCIPEASPGYGVAIRTGIQHSLGRCVVIGDADGSYPFSQATEIAKVLLSPEGEGPDYVIGNRYTGGIESGAMPWLNRHLGNPFLSFMVRLVHELPVHDVMCGLRAGRGALLRSLGLRSDGMDFAVELTLAAASNAGKVQEMPFPLAKDRREGGASHLNRWRDGLRVLALILTYVSSKRADPRGESGNLGRASPTKFWKDPGAWIFGLFSFGLVALTTWFGVNHWQYPEPNLHDEFAYLFQSKIFLSGHLTVPEPPAPNVLDSFHLLRENGKWFAKGPPGQPLLLMVGALLGHPIHAVWLLAAILGLGIFLLLRSFERRVGVRSSLPWWLAIAAITLAVFQNDLIWTYWGGSLAACGGVYLLAGALRECRVTLILSAVVLVLCRPFEGSLLLLASVLWFRESALARRWIIAGLVVGGSAFLGYQYLLLGRPFAFAQSVYAERFGDPVWVFDRIPQSVGSVIPEFQRFVREFSGPRWRLARVPFEFAKLRIGEWKEILRYWYGAFVPSGVVLMIGGVLWVRRRKLQRVWLNGLIGIFVFSLLSILPLYFFSHYFAPFYGVFWMIVIWALLSIADFRRGASHGGRAVMVILLSLSFLLVGLVGAGVSIRNKLQFEAERIEWGRGIRAPLVEQIKSQAGKHLVLVKYGPQHNIHREWVWNDPDPVNAQITWVRWLNGEDAKKAIALYPGREVWELTVQRDDQPRLIRLGQIKVQ